MKFSLIMGISAVLIVMVAFWLSGFNFNSRGSMAASCFCLSVAAFIYAAGSANKFNDQQ